MPASYLEFRGWIHQDTRCNGMSVAVLLSNARHFVGHDRYSGAVAGQTMAHLYGAVRRYVNYFQPSFKLVVEYREVV